MEHPTDRDEPHDVIKQAYDAPTDVSVPKLVDLLVESEGDQLETAIDALLTVLAEDRQEITMAIRMLQSSLTADEPRYAAIVALTRITSNYPETATDLAPTFVDMLDRGDIAIRRNALRSLGYIARTSPTAVGDYMMNIEPFLTSDLPTERRHATWIVAEVAEGRPELIGEMIDELIEIVIQDWAASGTDTAPDSVPDVLEEFERHAQEEDDHIRENAATALAAVAQERPDELVDNVSSLIDFLDPESPSELQVSVIHILAFIAEERPDMVTPAIEPLAEIVANDGYPTLQSHAARVLGILAETHRGAVVDTVEPALPSLFDLLDDENPSVRRSVTGLLSYIADHEPQAIEPVRSDLLELLDDPVPTVRASAMWALLPLGGPTLRERLRDIAATDPEPELQQLAEQILSQLE